MQHILSGIPSNVTHESLMMSTDELNQVSASRALSPAATRTHAYLYVCVLINRVGVSLCVRSPVHVMSCNQFVVYRQTSSPTRTHTHTHTCTHTMLLNVHHRRSYNTCHILNSPSYHQFLSREWAHKEDMRARDLSSFPQDHAPQPPLIPSLPVFSDEDIQLLSLPQQSQQPLAPSQFNTSHQLLDQHHYHDLFFSPDSSSSYHPPQAEEPDFTQFLALSGSPDLRGLFFNTTEGRISGSSSPLVIGMVPSPNIMAPPPPGSLLYETGTFTLPSPQLVAGEPSQQHQENSPKEWGESASSSAQAPMTLLASVRSPVTSTPQQVVKAAEKPPVENEDEYDELDDDLDMMDEYLNRA